MIPTLQRATILAADAARSLTVRPLRTAGMVVGVVVGVAAAVCTLMLTASERERVAARFDGQLATLVILESDLRHPPESRDTPSPPDETVLRAAPGTVDGGELSTWLRETQVQRNRYAPAQRAPVFGATPGGLRAAGVQALSGAELGEGGFEASIDVVWIGEQLAVDLGIDPADPAGTVLVDGARMSVAGVTSVGSRFPSLGRAVVLATPVARSYWPQPDQMRVVAHVRSGAARTAADYLVPALDPTGSMALVDKTPPDAGLLRAGVDSEVRRAGAAVSALSLLIGVISVANVLSISVLQRTAEFGVRSALGWTRGAIARLVLTEAIAAGALAGLVGTALGLGVAFAFVVAGGGEPVLPLSALWLATGAGVAAGAVGGVVPAVRAGSIDPLEALRN